MNRILAFILSQSSYLVALVSGGTVVLGCLHFSQVERNSRIRGEVFDLQQSIEVTQPQVVARRVEMEGQQERLNKGAAISETVGPAVVADIAALAEKANAPRLKELLGKHGFLKGGAPEPVALPLTPGLPGRKQP